MTASLVIVGQTDPSSGASAATIDLPGFVRALDDVQGNRARSEVIPPILRLIIRQPCCGMPTIRPCSENHIAAVSGVGWPCRFDTRDRSNPLALAQREADPRPVTRPPQNGPRCMQASPAGTETRLQGRHQGTSRHYDAGASRLVPRSAQRHSRRTVGSRARRVPVRAAASGKPRLLTDQPDHV